MVVAWWVVAQRMALAGPPPESVAPPVCVGQDPAAAARLAAAAKADQDERRANQWEGMEERDAARRSTVHELVDAGRICTPQAALDAATVLQHSRRTADHELGHRLAAWAAASGLREARRWAALAWDRALVSGGQMQWFGSQLVAKYDEAGQHDGMCLVEVDPAATDEMRKAAGMEPLARKIAWAYRTNDLKPPSDRTLDQARKDGLVCAPEPWQ